MLDQLKQIAIFAKTVDHGSFRGAARELNLSPSVVSHHISDLEKHLGVALLYRSTRKLALTLEGKQLLASTQPMLAAVQETFSHLSNTSSSPAGELRLTMPALLTQSHLTELLAAFSMKHPKIKLFLDFSDVRRDLITEGYDIAVRLEIQAESSAVSRKLFQIQRRLIASKTYLKSRPKATTPEALLDWDWVALSQVQHVKPAFQKGKAKPVSIKPTANIVTNDALAMYQLVRSGAGIAVVPEFLAEEGIKAGVIEYVLPKWKLAPIDVFAHWPANAPRHGLIKLFVNEISPAHSLKN